MSLSAATTLSGATISASGGTTVNWASTGLVGSKNTLVVTADTDFRTRRQIDAVIKQPNPQASAPNGYTQCRGSLLYKKPILLANGKITVNTVLVQVAYDVETSAAQVQDMLDVGAHFCFDSDFTAVVKSLSLA